jgi:hypothetical protein
VRRLQPEDALAIGVDVPRTNRKPGVGPIDDHRVAFTSGQTQQFDVRLLVTRSGDPVENDLAAGRDVWQAGIGRRRQGLRLNNWRVNTGTRRLGIEEWQDVRVLETGDGRDLLDEAVAAEESGQLGLEDLDGDLAVVPQVFGGPDGGHAAGAQLALDAISALAGAGEAVRMHSLAPPVFVLQTLDVLVFSS